MARCEKCHFILEASDGKCPACEHVQPAKWPVGVGWLILIVIGICLLGAWVGSEQQSPEQREAERSAEQVREEERAFERFVERVAKLRKDAELAPLRELYERHRAKR